MNLIAPFGFYGWGNIGDESTLQGFARLWGRSGTGPEPWVGSRNPRQCRRAEPSLRYFPAAASRSLRRRWAWQTSDAMVVPGGTPIMDVLGRWPLSELIPLVERAVSAGKPIAFVGTGSERLLREDSKRLVADVLAPNVCAWTVRSERDRDRLLQYGVTPHAVTTAADLAWELRAVSSDFGKEYLASIGVDLASPIVGVNVNIEQFVRDQQPRLLSTLAAFLDALVETRDASMLFLCNEVREGETFDLATSRELIGFMRHQGRARIVPNEYWLPQEMMSFISCCQFTVSTRYHFCLFSALQEVPFLAVQRSQKVSDLCADLEWPHGVSLGDVDLDGLVALVGRIEDNRQQLVGQLRAALPRMQERCGRNVVALTTLLERVRQSRS